MTRDFRPWLIACIHLGAAILMSLAVSGAAAEAPGAVETPAARIAELRAAIAYHDDLYFQKGEPEISDFEYDTLKAELQSLERSYPDAAGSSIPSGNPLLPSDRSGRFPTHRHRVPMQSLDKTYTDEDVRAFHGRVIRQAGAVAPAFVVEPKIDGIAISVTFEHGRLTRAVTRGDGVDGDDITENILTIADFPRVLEGGPVPDLVEIRGEVFLTFEAFARLNREREAAGEPLFVNPRNAAAGSAKLTNPHAVAARGLSIACYGMGACVPETARPHSQQALLAQLRAWGIPVVDRSVVVRGAEEIFAAVRDLGKARSSMPYPIDGAVVKIDEAALCAELGDGPDAPRWAIAYKYAPLRASTRVKAVTIQVGRTGVLTPVAEFEPVALDGSTVARASLHNRDVLKRLDVRVGDVVFVEKAGEIIPQIVGVNRTKRSADSAPFVFPEQCPDCATKIEASGGGVLLRCPNKACPAQVRRRLEHFASVGAANIEGLGPATIDALVSRGWLNDVAGIYSLRREQLLGLGTHAVVSTDALLASIERSRTAELWRVIYGLSITGVGETTARDLASVYPDLTSLSELSAGDFVPGGRAADLGLSRTTVADVVEYFAVDDHRAVVRKLVMAGMDPRSGNDAGSIRSTIVGKVFVLTGRLEHLSRDGATSRIRAAGGRVAASVSRKTDYVVAGEDPGEKLTRARELAVPVIDEAELLQMLEK